MPVNLPSEDLLLVREHLQLVKTVGYFGSGLPDSVPFVHITGTRPGGRENSKVAMLKLQMVWRDSEQRKLYVRLGAFLKAPERDGFVETTASGRRPAAPFELQVTLKQLQGRKMGDHKVVLLDLDDIPLIEGPFQQVGS